VTPRVSSSSSTFSFPSSPASACSFASTPKIGPVVEQRVQGSTVRSVSG
jgi:hypothetical protein